VFVITNQDPSIFTNLSFRPPRCSIHGRKPQLIPLYGIPLGDMCVRALDKGESTPVVLRVIATLPSTSFDCGVVLGGAHVLQGGNVQSSQSLAALCVQLKQRNECLLVQRTDRFGISLHIASAPLQDVSAKRLVMVRVASSEDTLIINADNTDNADDVPSEAVTRELVRALDQLPHPSSFSPLSFSCNRDKMVATAIVNHADEIAAISASVPTTMSSRGLIKGVLKAND
jgi:hypothetical protein